jgi:putative acetyltransferase
MLTLSPQWYKRHGYQLCSRYNEEWITRYFRLEDEDVKTLENPAPYILESGGYIGMAFAGEEAVGCCALLRLEDGVFEVAKMTVAPSWQGRGLGRKVLEHVIRKPKNSEPDGCISKPIRH